METEWKIGAPELAESLAQDFDNGLVIDDRGRRYLIEKTVATVQGLKIEIFSNEHPPPHFRVAYAGETANFTIKDCTKLNGGLKKWERNIKMWHSKNKQALIEAWDSRRPSDCPVGKYRE